MDPVMAADSNHAGEPPPPSLCPTCRLRPKRSDASSCRECHAAAERARYQARKDQKKDQKNVPRKLCPNCWKPIPHQKSGGCPETARLYFIRRGREKLNERWPGYGSLLTDEALLKRVGQNWPRVSGFPPPSLLFPGLDPALDQRLTRDHRDKDVMLCHALAAVQTANQQEFYELYLIDPADARHWASLPRWKRRIRAGDPDDVQIWKFFTIHRLTMERAAREGMSAWAMSSQGAQLSQTFGTIRYLSPQGVQKLVDVMGTYGDMLQYGRDLGDVTKKPWDEKT